jgi:branched-chain amino acid transport system permease protein
MVSLEFRRDRIVFRYGDQKYEWVIEPRYWRNPVIGALILMVLPFLVYQYPNILTMITTANIYAAIAIMLSLQTIGTARLNFGPQFYVGIGGYTAALLNLYFGLNPALTLIVTILVSLLFAFLISPIVLIARGLYFALITLILPLIFLEITFVYGDIFRGESGLSGIAPLLNLGSVSWNYLAYYFLSLTMMLIYLLVVDKTMRSRYGLAMAAINDNEDVARTVGVNVNKYKILSYVIPSVGMGVAGWFIAHTFRTFAGITYLSLDFMVKILLMIIIGGRASIYGSIVGGYFVAFLEEGLRTLGPINYVVFPLTLILCVYILPEGLWGLYHKRHYRDYYPKLRVRRR